MSRFQVKQNERIREKYYYAKHESGLDLYVIPKKHGTAYALFATRYGAMDNTFQTSKSGKILTVPDGIAHFLEHKLFENSDGVDTFLRFSEYGANCNAYTSNQMTGYLFSATEHYYESLRVLLEFVTDPYFTKETVDKEMGIIEQELRMYEDNPYISMYQQLLSAMYRDHPIRIPVGGTVESIHQINAEILYDCYHTFYNLNNMALCVCGDFDPDRVYEVCTRSLKKSEEIVIEKKVPEEQRRIVRRETRARFPVAMPLFCIGMKECDIPPGGENDGRALLKKSLEHEILSEILFGKSGELFNSLYGEGLINHKFSASYRSSQTFGYLIVSGEGDNPAAVFDRVRAQIEAFRKDGGAGIAGEDFERARRVIYSGAVQAWNSTGDIADEFIEQLFNGSDLLDVTDILAQITPEDVRNRLLRSYHTELLAISVAEPV